MTKEGFASLRASRARAATRVRGGTATPSGGGGTSGRPVYFYNPKTGSYTYRVGGGSPGGGWQRLGTTQPAGYVGGRPRGVAVEDSPRVKSLIKEGGYFYQPTTGAITQQRVSGQRPMTKQEATHYKETYVEKGLSPYQTSAGKPLTISEHKRIYEQELRARKVTRAEVLTLAEGIRAGRPTPTEVPKPKYEPTALGGIKLGWAKLKTIPDVIWEKVQKKYTTKQLGKGAQDISKFSEKMGKIFKFKEVKDVGIKTKERTAKHPLVQDVKQFVGVTPKGFQWAKKEFGLEIKTEAQKFKGVRDWDKDMKKIEDVFLKSREGYVWAEGKAKGLELKPVKQPAFLKGAEPYKEFRTQTKKQIVGAAQIGKVTMGATTGVVEDIKLKPWKLPLIYATGVVAGPVATKVIGTGKVAKIATIGFGTTWAAGIGVETAMTPAGIEREKKIGVRTAELIAFLGGAKYSIEKKPLSEFYKAKVRGPRFEKAYKVWEKGITSKQPYLEKRGFLSIKGKPQRTLYGEPISPKKIKWLRAEVHPGILRYEPPKELAGYKKLVQKPLRDIYVRKAIDLRYPKFITITPEKMKTFGYRGILETQPKSFVFKKPPIVHRVGITKVDKSMQTMLAPKVRKVTKYDRPFYISKPKLPKPVKLGKPKKIGPVHVTPEHKPIKIKPTEVMSGVSVRPVYVAEPKPDVGLVLGTIPKGQALAGAVASGGLRFGARDLTKALSRQFSGARQRAEQRAISSQALDKATKEKTKTPTKQIPKVVPKLKPAIRTAPKLKQPTRQIPKLRQPVPTKPFIPYPTYPIHKEPKIPKKITPLKIPEFKWPRGKFYPTTRKLKKFKRPYQYQPSLVAGFEKITAPKIPKRITGLGIRPVVRFKL